MKARTEICHWCKMEYAIKDSTAQHICKYCSEECEEEEGRLDDECDKWYWEIHRALKELRNDYELSEDECDPCHYCGEDGEGEAICVPYARDKGHYLAFRDRYRKWKHNHCWKKSFWEWDGKSLPEPTWMDDFGKTIDGLGETIVSVVVLVVVVWLGWMGIKCGWNLLFGGEGEVDVQIEMMKSWQQHLERRYEAFDNGISEKEIEAKGLKNYTWEEWQKLPPAVEKKEAELIGDKSKALRRNIVSNEEKDPEENKTGERQSTETLNSEGPHPVTPKIEELPPPTLKVEEPRASPPKVERANPVIPPLKSMRPASYNLARAGNDTVKNTVGGRDGTKKPATKDSKRIVIDTQGKGTTKAAAVRSALRQAVWKTVGTWVDSKVRMDEKRVQVVALVKTVTEADVVKFEVEDTQQQNGTFVVKVRVWVSKKQISPKFEKVFPDVFGND